MAGALGSCVSPSREGASAAGCQQTARGRLGQLSEETALCSFPAFEEKGHCVHFFLEGGWGGIERAESLPREHMLLPAAPTRASTDRPAGLQQEGVCGTPGSFASSPASSVGKHGYPHQFLLWQKRTGCVLNQLSTLSSEANAGFFIAS